MVGASPSPSRTRAQPRGPTAGGALARPGGPNGAGLGRGPAARLRGGPVGLEFLSPRLPYQGTRPRALAGPLCGPPCHGLPWWGGPTAGSALVALVASPYSRAGPGGPQLGPWWPWWRPLGGGAAYGPNEIATKSTLNPEAGFREAGRGLGSGSPCRACRTIGLPWPAECVSRRTRGKSETGVSTGPLCGSRETRSVAEMRLLRPGHTTDLPNPPVDRRPPGRSTTTPSGSTTDPPSWVRAPPNSPAAGRTPW